MSIWLDEDVEARLIEVLDVVPVGPAHHFGRPYMSAYQLAIELDRLYPQVAQALGYPVGGAGIGERNSLAQYVAKQLSDRIRADTAYPIEGAFMTNIDVELLQYIAADGTIITSSLTDSGFDLSLFRRRLP